MTATYSETTGIREIESNDEYANLVSSGSKITGQSSSSTDDDWYYLEVTSAGTITVDFENDNSFSAHDVIITDADGDILSKKSIYSDGSLSAEVAEADNYFVLVEDSSDVSDYAMTFDVV